ncbi:hypothetical protein L6452_26714 [Arctium lappa]|uniref:Uncharacterized protein n=1 Tax=Arctium lappa TaxID=4217 RepID=A0ACB8ZW18_ARCLA|nr:hypothetical protein L6452_26714 [Arctium lappa]
MASSQPHLPSKLHHRGLSSGSVCYVSDRTDTPSAIVVLSVGKVINKRRFFIDDISNAIAATNHCIISQNNNHLADCSMPALAIPSPLSTIKRNQDCLQRNKIG